MEKRKILFFDPILCMTYSNNRAMLGDTTTMNPSSESISICVKCAILKREEISLWKKDIDCQLGEVCGSEWQVKHCVLSRPAPPLQHKPLPLEHAFLPAIFSTISFQYFETFLFWTVGRITLSNKSAIAMWLLLFYTSHILLHLSLSLRPPLTNVLSLSEISQKTRHWTLFFKNEELEFLTLAALDVRWWWLW